MEAELLAIDNVMVQIQWTKHLLAMELTVVWSLPIHNFKF